MHRAVGWTMQPWESHKADVQVRLILLCLSLQHVHCDHCPALVRDEFLPIVGAQASLWMQWPYTTVTCSKLKAVNSIMWATLLEETTSKVLTLTLFCWVKVWASRSNFSSPRNILVASCTYCELLGGWHHFCNHIRTPLSAIPSDSDGSLTFERSGSDNAK